MAAEDWKQICSKGFDARSAREAAWTTITPLVGRGDVSLAGASAGGSARGLSGIAAGAARDARRAAVSGARGPRPRGSFAGAGHGSGPAARIDGAAALRPFAVQRAPALLRLHHGAAGPHRDPRRLPRGGREPECRSLDTVARRHRDRIADRAMDCG